MLEVVLTLVGVAFGAVMTWFTAKSQQKGELERLHVQLRAEWRHKNQIAWQQQFIESVADLLAATDPEIHDKVDKSVVVPLIHKAQLCLNPNVQEHAKCNASLNELALAVNGWQGKPGTVDIFVLSSNFLQSARDTIWLPGK